MADGNKERALLLMTNHVQAANAIYKNTGFADANKPEGMKALTYYTVVVHGKALKCIQMEYTVLLQNRNLLFQTILNMENVHFVHKLALYCKRHSCTRCPHVKSMCMFCQ